MIKMKENRRKDRRALAEKQTGTLSLGRPGKLRGAGRTFNQRWGYKRASGILGYLGIPQPVLDVFGSLSDIVEGLWEAGVSIFPELGRASTKFSNFIRGILSFDTAPFFTKAFSKTAKVTSRGVQKESFDLAGFIFEGEDDKDKTAVVKGCMDTSALNYNPSATLWEPGSCDYSGTQAVSEPEEEVPEEEEPEEEEEVISTDEAGTVASSRLVTAMIDDMSGLKEILNGYDLDSAPDVLSDFMNLIGATYDQNEFDEIFDLLEEKFSLDRDGKPHKSIMEKVVKPIFQESNRLFFEAMKNHYTFTPEQMRELRGVYRSVSEEIKPQIIYED